MSWVSSWWKAIARPKNLMVDWCQTFLGKCVVAGTPRITLFESPTSFKHLSSFLYVGTYLLPIVILKNYCIFSRMLMSSCLDLLTGLFAEREPLCFWGLGGAHLGEGATHVYIYVHVLPCVRAFGSVPIYCPYCFYSVFISNKVRYFYYRQAKK